MSIILSGVSFHYPNRQPLFERVNLSVASGGKAAVIGNNGTGKSTLLKLIAGELEVSSGSVYCASTPYYIPQQAGITGMTVSEALGVSAKIEALHAICNGSDKYAYYETLADDWDIESRCRAALDHWRLPDAGLTTPVSLLSGGEKTKLFLAGLSVHRPGIVLLDEPTNHLDYGSREKLYGFIAETKATVLVVSHDMTLLNLLEDTYELSPEGVRRYGGNYDFYRMQKEMEEQALEQQINAEETALRLARRKAEEVNERQEKRSRQGEKHKDQLTRAMRKLVKNSGENTGAKLKDKHAAIIDRNNQRLSDLRRKQNSPCELKLDFENAQLHDGKLLIAAQGVNFRYAGKDFLWRTGLDIEIRSGERIHLRGDNGAGKTTLLKLLTGELLPGTGELRKADFSFVYLDQEYSKVRTRQTLLELAQAYNRHNLPEHELKLRLHRALFPKDMWDKRCDVLSGGERMRLYLCCLMISNAVPDLFILDEPTNNLDLPSLEILTTLLKNYRGTLLVISHDQRFAEEVGITKVIGLK